MTQLPLRSVLVALVRLFSLALVLLASASPGTAQVKPAVRVFLVDPVMLADMPQADGRTALGLIKDDIRMLALDPAHAPALGWIVMTRGNRSTEPFTATWSDASAREVDLGGLDMAVLGVQGRQITGSLDLPALRKALIVELTRGRFGAAPIDIVLHVFGNQWRTGTSTFVSRSSAQAVDTSKRPTQCFVEDQGKVAGVLSPWPETRRLWVELRPPHLVPTPSELALGNLIAVLVGQSTPVPYASSLGIAGPKCPPGMVRNVMLTAMDDPGQCDRQDYDPSRARSIGICRPDAPLLASTAAGLVRRPLNLVAVDGDGLARRMEIRPLTAPGGMTLSHVLGAVPIGSATVADLRQVLPQGSRGRLRTTLAGAGCTGATPLRADVVLGGVATTTASLVTAPVSCLAAGAGADLTFDLLDVQVN